MAIYDIIVGAVRSAKTYLLNVIYDPIMGELRNKD